MKKLGLASLVGLYALVASGAASAAGGMGDSSRLAREKDAICERQRHGQGPMYPNMCWPDSPTNSGGEAFRAQRQ